LAAPEQVGRAVGTVAAGLTISLFVGVPLGSLLGTAFGWRPTFMVVALLTLLVRMINARMLPPVPGAAGIGVRTQLRVLGRPAVLTCVLGTTMGASGGLLIYTYIGPITRDLTGHGGPLLALFIGVVGVAGALGTVAGGRLTDRWGADRALLGSFALLALAILALAGIGLGSGGTTPVWLTVIVLVAYGFAGWGFNPPMTTRALQLAGDAGTEAVALNTSALYVGISLAGVLGGAALTADGGRGAAIVAALICLAPAVALATFGSRYRSEGRGFADPGSVCQGDRRGVISRVRLVPGRVGAAGWTGRRSPSSAPVAADPRRADIEVEVGMPGDLDLERRHRGAVAVGRHPGT